MLMPSTCTARLMRAYTSTLYTSWYPTNTTTLYCSGLKVWWSTFGPPQTAAHAALRGLLLLRRLYVLAFKRLSQGFGYVGPPVILNYVNTVAQDANIGSNIEFGVKFPVVLDVKHEL